MNPLRIDAYAKINRYLAVTGVRDDGYHTLQTVMQSVSLCDTLTLRAADEFGFSCSVPALNGTENLCVKAARAFAKQTRTELPPYALYLEKRIPVGAGLGGGSADAAAVLRLLNHLAPSPLSERELYGLACGLGADVPFCLHGGKCLCTGIGEVLTPLPCGETEYLVIARGQAGLSTPEMYRRLDTYAPWKHRTETPGRGNDFERAAIQALPDIALLKRELLSGGASEASMSGSGSAVFGVFASEETAHRQAASLRQKGFFAVSCRTVFAY